MLGERLKRAREFRGFTQKGLGEQVNASDVTIARYESGIRKPDPETLAGLADALGVSADYLLGRVKEPEEVMAFHAERGYENLPEDIYGKIKAVAEYFIEEDKKKRR